MRRGLAILLLGGALIGAKAPAISPPEGWRDISEKGVCALQRGPIGIGTYDGIHFAIAVEGPKVKRSEVRPFQIGDQGAALVFEPTEGGVYADLSTGQTLQLFGATAVAASWLPGGGADITGAAEVYPLLRACGERVARMAADKEAKRAAFSDRLFAAGAVLQQGGSSPAPQSGGACILSREWTSGLNKNCVYNCTGSEAVQTHDATAICPLTMER